MNLQVGVKLIIQNSAGEILVLKRRGYGDLDGTWDIPGGRIESTEDLITGLKREVREEIGVDFVGKPQIIAAQDIFPADSDRHIVRLTHLLTEDIANINLSDEHSEYRYAQAVELIELPLESLSREVVADLVSSSLRNS